MMGRTVVSSIVMGFWHNVPYFAASGQGARDDKSVELSVLVLRWLVQMVLVLWWLCLLFLVLL